MPLISLCNPTPALETEKGFTQSWAVARGHEDSFLRRHPRVAHPILVSQSPLQLFPER